VNQQKTTEVKPMKFAFRNKLIPIFYILTIFLVVIFSAILPGSPALSDITLKGERNLKIISFIYEKYPFMPAKKEYFRHIQEEWLKGKSLYTHAHPDEKKDNYNRLLQSYMLTNDVLKDICIDMGNLSEAVVDDFSQRLVESETVKTNLGRDKNYNRFVVSRNEFSRAENGFKRGMYYYSARLYDHGLDVMKRIYSEQKWTFPKGKTSSGGDKKNDKDNVS
jgi:hypothetical protein